MRKNINTVRFQGNHIIACLVLLSIWISFMQGQEMVWKRSFDSGFNDYGWDVCSDSTGNIIVTGSSYVNPGNNHDFLTIKYNPDGDTIWTKRFNNSLDEYANCTAADYQGNIFIAGVTTFPTSGADYCTIKYSPTGELLWVRTYSSDSIRLDEAFGVAADSKGSVIVTGAAGNKDSSFDYLTIKYDADGNLIWARTYNYYLADKAQAVTVDSMDNIYVTGYSADSGGVDNWCTIKYDEDGSAVWIKREGNYANRHACCITVDKSNGDIIVGGSLFNCDLVRYDSESGNKIWQRVYMNQGIVRDITSDGTGCLYLENWHSSAPAGAGVFYTLKCNPSGDTLWTATYSEGFENQGMGICLDPYGNVIVSGISIPDSAAGNANYMTIKYSRPAGIPLHDLSDTPLRYYLYPNYPNPFNPATRIGYDLPAASHVQLKIYSQLGQEVTTLTDGVEGPGHHEVNWDASQYAGGIYFVRLTAGNSVKIRHMLLIK